LKERTITRTTLSWIGLTCALIVPFAIAATSPLLAWREPLYIAAAFAGVFGLGLLLLQPLLAGNALPGLTAGRSTRLHRLIGIVLIAAVALHVIGLWFTSPPDVVDALLFRSPTPFSVWGVIAMWAIVGAALLAACRRHLQRHTWRIGHTMLAIVTVASTAAHALLIEGTMGAVSKALLCVLVLGATVKVVVGKWT